jgi:hypothetical protein
MVTEFGGLSVAPEEGQDWFGYATHASAAELEAGFLDLVQALLESREVAGFCYTQLTDTFQETNGILDAERRPKIAAAAVRRALNAPAASVPHELVDRARQQARTPTAHLVGEPSIDGTKSTRR